MNIYEAMTVYLLSGKSVRREAWEGSTAIYPQKDGKIIYRREPGAIGWEWKPQTVDLSANDWVVCK